MRKYEVNWIQEPIDGNDWSWVENVFRELGHYYDDYIEKVAEMPFNYTERSILGSLAIAANKCKYYTLLDYGTKVKERYRYCDFWITMEPRDNSYDVVFEAKKFKRYSIEANNKKFKESVTRKIKRIHEILDENEMGKAEEAHFQCALLAFQFRIDKDKWDNFDNNSYDEKWDKLQNGQEKQKKDNAKWVDEDSICSFWYLYWVPFNKIKDLESKGPYWKPQETRPQYCKPALGLLIIGSFRTVESGVRR